jgi:TolB-like protein/DNA-binding winged helix-turn-helix (wHTH) protein/Flp pilus assembly protein TadD
MPVGRLNFSCRANRQKIQDFPAVMRAGKGNYARIARPDLGWRTAVASEPEASQKTIKVAEGFELDPAAYELRRSGHVVKLERLPMEILLFLIEQRGQVVTREEIADRIWGKNVHVDTDNSINGAIRKIRRVLRDDPDSPRFIQTIMGRGYRFIAAVDTSAPEPSPDPLLPAISDEPESIPLAEVSKSGLRRWSVLLAAAVFLIAVAAAGFLRFSPRVRPASGRLMLAVLPFENLTGDAAQDYFSDGMTEEMISQLGNLDAAHLGVIARTSVMHYKHSPEPLDQIGRELGVQYVLEGSIRRDSDKVRITAQLIQLSDQTHLWARQYDRDLSHLLALQGEIAHEVSEEIQIALWDRKPITPLAPQALFPQNYEAYDLYLKGQYFWNKRTVEGFERAIDYYQQAIAKDPNYARAYAGLADSYALIASYSAASPSEYMPKARAAALRALELDKDLPEAHTALALIVQNYDYDWQTAGREFQRAIELNPNYATAHHWYAEHLMWRGRFDEALRESERARQLDPLSLIIATDNGAILLYSRQYDRALEKLHAVHELDPSFPRVDGLTVRAYEEKGTFPDALAELEKSRPLYNSWACAELAYIYGRTGQPAQAAVALARMEEFNRGQPVDPVVFVEPYIGMDRKDEAFLWLNKAYAQHSNALTALKVDPLYDPLRSDPRFQDLLRRVGLSQ